MTDTGSDAVNAALGLAWTWLLAFGIAMARPMAMLALMPVFSRVPLTGLLRGAVAAALALPMVGRLMATNPAAGHTPILLLLLSVKEGAIGAALGVLLGVPFWALDVAGDVVDAQRGATQGRLNDPAGFEDVSITGTMLTITAIALFVVTGGLETVVRLLYGSYALWPPLASLPGFGRQTPVLLLGLLDRITEQGVLLAMPLLLAMLVSDAALFILARLAPGLRVDDLALATRNVVFSIVLTVYAGFLVVYIRHDLSVLDSGLELLRDSLAAAPAGPAP